MIEVSASTPKSGSSWLCNMTQDMPASASNPRAPRES